MEIQEIVESVQKITGVLVIWIAFIWGFIKLLGFILIPFLNFLGRKFRILWIAVEFTFYYSEFKEWVKTKKRHPKTQTNKK